MSKTGNLKMLKKFILFNLIIGKKYNICMFSFLRYKILLDISYK
ncbi:hypothetical protein ES705_12925 [subsurface metagenome]